MQGSTIIPSVRYRDAHAAIAWLVRVFGFTAHVVYDGPDNTVAHAELTLGSGMVMIGSASNPNPNPEVNATPESIGWRVTSPMYVVVPDCEPLYASTKAAGARVLMELKTMDYGGKAFAVTDPEGYVWSFGEYDPWAAQPSGATQAALPAEENAGNPYKAALGAEDAQQVLCGTTAKLAGLLATLTPEQQNASPAPGKWSPREVLCHMADCELAFGFRLRQIYAGVPDIQPFEQDDWARAYAGYTAEQAVQTFTTLRAWNLSFIAALADADRKLTSQHPERGTITLQTAVENIAGHDMHHLRKMRLL